MADIINNFKKAFPNKQGGHGGDTIYVPAVGASGFLNYEKFTITIGDDAVVRNMPWVISQLNAAWLNINLGIPILIELKEDYDDSDEGIERLLSIVESITHVKVVVDLESALRDRNTFLALTDVDIVNGVGVSAYFYTSETYDGKDTQIPVKQFLKELVNEEVRYSMFLAQVRDDIMDGLS